MAVVHVLALAGLRRRAAGAKVVGARAAGARVVRRRR